MSRAEDTERRSLQTEAGALRSQLQALVGDADMTKEIEKVSEALRSIATGAHYGDNAKIKDILDASTSALADILLDRPDITSLYFDEIKQGDKVVLAQDFVVRFDERNVVSFAKYSTIRFENDPAGEVRFRVLPANTLVGLSHSRFPINTGILVYKDR